MDVLLQAKGWLLAAAAVLAGGHGAPAHAAHAHHPQTRTEHRLQLGSNLTVSTQGSVVRTDSCWECVEPAPGVWDWCYDNTLSHEFGRRWQPVLDYAPAWATPGGRTPPADGWQSVVAAGRAAVPPVPGAIRAAPRVTVVHPAPSDVAAYAAYAAKLAARYHPRVIEVWNEPDINVYWNPPDPAAYARLFVAADRAIKRVSPNTVVLASGLDETNAPWFLPPLARALHGVVPDGWSVHPYANTVAGMVKVIRLDETLLRGYHVMAPLYVTEYGCWAYRICPADAAFRRAAIDVLAHDPNVVQADWFGDIP